MPVAERRQPEYLLYDPVERLRPFPELVPPLPGPLPPRAVPFHIDGENRSQVPFLVRFDYPQDILSARIFPELVSFSVFPDAGDNSAVGEIIASLDAIRREHPVEVRGRKL